MTLPRIPSRYYTCLAALVLLCLLTPLWSGSSFALPSDRGQPIRIESDRAERDEKAGTTHYQGNVLVTQGTMQIKADSITVFSDGKQVNLVIAKGNPVHLQQQPALGEPIVHARGETVEYHLTTELIRLLGKASLVRGSSTVNSDKIDYYIADQVVKANQKNDGDGDGTPRQRVEVVIHPQQNDAQTEQADEQQNDAQAQQQDEQQNGQQQLPEEAQQPTTTEDSGEPGVTAESNP